MNGFNELQTHGNGDCGMNSVHIAQYGATDAGMHWKKIGKVHTKEGEIKSCLKTPTSK